MLIKPKLYARELINGKEIDKLDGYLLKDEKYVNELIIPNRELKYSTTIETKNIVNTVINNLNSVSFKVNK
jgi:hypothetical protein